MTGTAAQSGAIDVTIAKGNERRLCVDAYRDWGYDGPIAASDCVLRARRNGELVGVVRLAPEHAVLVLRGMQVAPHARGAGVGHALLRAASMEIGTRACYCMPYMHLTRFYRSAGFIEMAPERAPRFLGERLQASRAMGLSVCLMLRPAADPRT